MLVINQFQILDYLNVSVSLRGTVIIIANHGDRIDIPAGAILENKIVSGNLRILDHWYCLSFSNFVQHYDVLELNETNLLWLWNNGWHLLILLSAKVQTLRLSDLDFWLDNWDIENNFSYWENSFTMEFRLLRLKIET